MSSIRKHMVLAGLIITLATTAFAVAPVYADTADTAVSTTQAETAQVFTIDKAIEYAKANNRTLASVKATEEYQKYYQDEARLTFKNTKKAANKVGISDINTSLVANGFTYRAAKLSYRAAQRNTIITEYTLECDISQAFYGYLSWVRKEEYAKEHLKLAQNNAAYAQINFDNGIISENDLIELKNTALKAQYDLNAVTRNKEYSMMQLKSILNYPQDKELIVTGEFTRRPISAYTYEQALEKAKTSLRRANTEENFALAKEKCERYHRYYTSNQAAWHSAAAEFANAELSYNNALEEERLTIYNLYNTMLTAYETLDYCDKQVELCDKLLKAAKINYDAGIITTNDYILTTQAYNNAKNAMVDADLAAYMSVVLYEATFNCENTIFEEDDPLL